MDASIIVVSHGNNPSLDEALRSATDQDSDLIVVIDGSEHSGVALLISRQPRIRLYSVTPASGGPATPRNLGASKALGRYLLFLDHDDLLMPGALASLLAAASEADWPAVVYGNVLIRHPDGSESSSFEEYRHLRDPLDLIKSNSLPIHSAIVRRDWFDRVGGFDATLAALEDWHLWAKIGLAGGTFTAVDNIVGIYRQHEGSRNSVAERGAEGLYQMYEELFHRFPNQRPQLKPQYIDAGLGLVIARIRAAKHYGNRSWLQTYKPIAFLLKHPLCLTKAIFIRLTRLVNTLLLGNLTAPSEESNPSPSHRKLRRQ